MNLTGANDDLLYVYFHLNKFTNTLPSVSRIIIIMKTSIKKELFSSLVASQLMFSFGAVMGYTAYLLPELRDAKHINFEVYPQSLSIIAISGTFLMPAGTISNMYILEKCGRKGTMVLTMFISTIAWLITAFALNVQMIIIGRMINSLVMGFTTCCDVYISETCSTKHRGTFAALFSPQIALGGFFVYLLVYMFGWRVAALIMAVYTLAVFLLLGIIPESKHWYATKNRLQEAKSSLIWFTKCSELEAERELEDIRKSIPDNVSFSEKWKMFSRPMVLKRFVSVSILHILLQWSGVTLIINYAVDFFALFETKYDKKMLALISGFCSFFGSIALVPIVHLFKRRTFMIGSELGMLISILLILAYRIFKLQLPTVVPVICVLLYLIFYGLGIGDIAWIILPEMFPTLIRGPVISVISTFSLSNIPIILYLYEPILNYLSFDGLCAIFALSNLCVLLITFFFIPETSNIPLHLVGLEEPIPLKQKTESRQTIIFNT